MLHSLELIVNPGRSATYRRMLVIIYLLTAALIIYSSLYTLIKVCLLVFFAVQFNSYFRKAKPHPKLYEIKHVQNQWIITLNDQVHICEEVAILIHNILFQVLQCSSSKKNKIIILFNDQLSNHQLRLLHLKTINIGI